MSPLVVALFPSLTSKRTGEIIRNRIMKSEIEFVGFDYDQGRRYIVLNEHLTGGLGDLRRVLPWRRKAGGTIVDGRWPDQTYILSERNEDTLCGS